MDPDRGHEDESGFAGNALPNAPQHKVDVWTRYCLPRRLSRMALAGGVVYVSERFTARDNRVRVPAYTRLDANALVELLRSRLELALVAENLTDARYVTSGTGVLFAGPPRRLAATLATRF